jgi:mRNA interferase RelE/StbE
LAYRVELKPSAVKELAKLAKPLQRRIAAKIDALADDPRPHGWKSLEGANNILRVRVGDYRILYTLHHKELLVLVIHIGDRKEVYRRLSGK